MYLRTQLALAAAIALMGISMAMAGTDEPAQMNGLGTWTTTPVFTIGETLNGYTPVGIPDGMGAFKSGGKHVVILSNHELTSMAGAPYTLANGAELRGSRVSYMKFDKKSRELEDMGLAYDTIYNRAGKVVENPGDLDFGGLNRLCSAGYFAKKQAGFEDDVFLTGEETSGGGTEFALDVKNGKLYAAPWMGRAAWESVAALEDKELNEKYVAILVGDDRGDAPLLLYVGKKEKKGNFLERNGLANGKLYMWVADDGDLSPAHFNGTGAKRKGTFVEVVNYDADQAGSAGGQGELGFDELGFATQAELDNQKAAIGAFNFSRPEDLHTNPKKGKEVVFASTGRNTAINQGKDLWGTTYLIKVKIDEKRIKKGGIEAELTILYDGDDADKQDFGIRSPDNLVWAEDGQVYIQEDRSVGGFGAASGEEASIWQLDPKTSWVKRVGQINRDGVPSGQTDTAPANLGNWESSGIIDVTELFDAKDERLLFFNVQAHSVRGGAIDSENLVQGGQFLFMSKAEKKGKGEGEGEDKD